jgi:hypothetical protein
MNEHRKNIIIKEILYWKENRMLPEQYCDFLLTLYTEGNRPKEQENWRLTKRMRFQNVLYFLLISFSLFVIYFTELSFILQMAFVAIFVLVGLAGIYYFSRKNMSYQFPFIALALILLFSSVEIVSGVFPKSQLPLVIVVILNCVLWYIAGWKLKLLYFKISAYLGFIIVIILFLYNNL